VGWGNYLKKAEKEAADAVVQSPQVIRLAYSR
jgi:hypothetical protein